MCQGSCRHWFGHASCCGRSPILCAEKTLALGERERVTRRARDVLLDFFGAVDVAVPARSRPQQCLMPRALETTQWNHLLDTVMRRALCSCHWCFQILPEKRKAIIRFFKERQPDVLRDLTGQGFGAIAQLIIKGTFPYCAQWRWCTLEKACQRCGDACHSSSGWRIRRWSSLCNRGCKNG